jgi:hypothetical protein
VPCNCVHGTSLLLLPEPHLNLDAFTIFARHLLDVNRSVAESPLDGAFGTSDSDLSRFYLDLDCSFGKIKQETR